LLSVASPNDLTPRQRDAVTHRNGNLLLEAVPGSGKTRVIVARCADLLDHGVAAGEILLLTFSRRAVSELRTRLTRVIAGDALPDVRTFHGFAARILAETGSAGRSRRLLSVPAQRALFENAIEATPLSSLPPGVDGSLLFREAASAHIDELRRSTPAALIRLSQRTTPRITDLRNLAAKQTQLRDRLGVADYDDLVARAVELASTPGTPLAKMLPGRYKHVLIDEFQDTDALQLALVELLSGEIFAVGDSAQAIYGFRGAARSALARARTALAMTTLSLDESFRCPAAVCDLARSVWPEPPKLHCALDRPSDITFRRAASPRDEAAFIGQAIARAIEDGTTEHEIAVLVRGAEPLARLVEQHLRSQGIAVARHGGEDVLDDLAVDVMCAALSALAEPADAGCWRRLFEHPVLGSPPLALRFAFDTAPPQGFDDACAFAERFLGHARVPGAQLAGALRSAREFWNSGDPVRAARSFAAETNVLGFVVDGNEREVQRSSRRITSFLDALADVRDVHVQLGLDAGSASVFEDFLVCSESWAAQSDSAEDDCGVRILTVHAAKGLEFDFVAIADAVDDRFPQNRRTDRLLSDAEVNIARSCGVDLGTRATEHLDEERSLWYVAVTRSKKALLVTWSETDLDGSPQRPSRFIPLDARMREQREPSFSAALSYAPAPGLLAVQVPSSASLERPVASSKLDTFLDCRRKFYYSALLRIERDKGGFKATLGKLVHRAIQEFHSTIRDFRRIPEGASTAWSARLRDLVRDLAAADPKLAFDSALESAAALRAADRFVDRYARGLEDAAARHPGGFEVVASEEFVMYEHAGIALAGKIDRIDRRPDGSLVLVDVKTGAFKKEKAMASAFPKLAAAAAAGELWIKARPPANPQLALYRHAKPNTSSLAYVYLDSRPKFGQFTDAAHTDELEIENGAEALTALDDVLTQTFFDPWSTGAVTNVEPTRNARTCRFCDFVTVCPGFLEDED
jgi:DNA helicase-2/ATP-dependent DNA helicase PcrA